MVRMMHIRVNNGEYDIKRRYATLTTMLYVCIYIYIINIIYTVFNIQKQ